MTDARHGLLLSVVRKLPSDFEPWGERSRDEESCSDCSCGCRWFIPLEGKLRRDWGTCANARSPRCGLLTFEHQGCREFEAEREPPEGEAVDACAPRSEAAERLLLANLRRSAQELEDALSACSDHWGYEDPVYRFYHQSFKVFGLQEQTRSIVALLERMAPSPRPLCSWFSEIVEQGTGRTFRIEDNANWTQATRPILEAFFHARFHLEMAVRYGTLEEPPSPLPSGYAALLSLYGMR